MYVVIFRAHIQQLDTDYQRIAAQLRELALSQYHCIEFIAISEGEQEIALSYWHSEADIQAWKAQSDHLLAQQLGRTQWYQSWSVQVANITRAYASPMG